MVICTGLTVSGVFINSEDGRTSKQEPFRIELAGLAEAEFAQAFALIDAKLTELQGAENGELDSGQNQ